MGLLDNLKNWVSCVTSGRMEEYKHYKDCLERNKSDIKMWTGFKETAERRFEEVKKKFLPDSKEYIKAKSEIGRWQETIDGALLSQKFIRPNSKEDIEYRDDQSVNFVARLREALSVNFDLRFHGTPIYYAEQIIKSGKISSTADRYDGYIKSTDRVGEISASDRESIVDTMTFFTDMSAYYSHSLPAGCIFAILPKDEEDAKYGKNLLRTVDFKQNPEQLFGVFTTPENIERVKDWIGKSGLNSELVYTFEEFLEQVKEQSKIADEQAKMQKSEDVSKDSQNMGLQVEELHVNQNVKTINSRVENTNSSRNPKDEEEIEY